MTMQPQEIEVWYIIPSLRRELAAALVKKGLTQRRVAELLGVTEAAVSQYMSKKRAHEVVFGKEIRIEIGKAADAIAEGGCVVAQVQRLCGLVKKKGLLCKVHRKEEEGVCGTCKICMEGCK